MTDDEDMRRRRALYRARHRGTKEMDHMVGCFADAKVPQLSGAELSLFELFLELPDPLLHTWCFETGAEHPPQFTSLVLELRAFHGLGGDARTGS